METEFLRWLAARLPSDPRLPLGLRDDAALLRLASSSCVLTTDLLSNEVDFELSKAGPRRAGRKALAVNLSDLAAMAARPIAALVSLALPRDSDWTLARELYEGLLPLAEKYQVAIAGGDTNVHDGPLVVSVTLLGEPHPRGLLTRSAARPGDVIVVTGQFGGSILGHHLDFEPRVHEALELKSRYDVVAGMDVSDGLSLDLSRLAQAGGCGAELELDRIPISAAAVTLARQLADGSTPLDHALSDGEDFELLLAVPPAAAATLLAEQPLACGLTAIGRFVAEPGLWQCDGGGVRRPLEPRGFEH